MVKTESLSQLGSDWQQDVTNKMDRHQDRITIANTRYSSRA